MTSIFLSTGLAMIEEANLIEDKNQEYQNNKDIFNGRGSSDFFSDLSVLHAQPS
jgi:hypothetical protein